MERHQVGATERRRSMKPKSWLSVAFLAAVAVAGLVVVERPVGAASGPGLVNSHADLCAQPVGGATDATAPIVLEPCADIAEQHWFQIPVPGQAGQFSFRNAKSGLCLEVPGSTPADGTRVIQWPCVPDGQVPISNERWTFSQFGFPPAPMVSRLGGSSSTCLDVPGGSTQPGTALQVFTCNGTAAQQWEIGNG